MVVLRVVYNIVMNILVRRDILARQHFSHLNRLLSKSVTRNTDSPRDPLQVCAVVSAASVEVVKDDIRRVERIGGTERQEPAVLRGCAFKIA